MPNYRMNPLNGYRQAAWGTAIILLVFSSGAHTSERSVNIIKDNKFTTASIEPTMRTLTASGKTYLVGPDGMTLYAMVEGRDSVRDCQRGCADNWPPLVTRAKQPIASPLVDGKIGIVRRLPPDNRLQVTYEGRPLHYWSRDTAPGDATGHGIGGIWYQVTP